jgi:hypothetical protein
MSSPPSDAKRIPGYNLAAPTESDALASLQRVFGPDRGLKAWSDACALAGVMPGQVNSSALLERAIGTLARTGGAAATVASSMTIRMRTHKELQARSARTKTGGRP